MSQEDWLHTRSLFQEVFILFIYSLLCCWMEITYSADGAFYSHNDIKINNLGKNNQLDVKRRFQAWKNLIASQRHQPIEQKLTSTNNFFNSFYFQSDLNYQGEEDYWKSPEEFLIDGSGDCEDFSIAKYFTLLAMEVPLEKLRITYVKSLQLNKAHMVLAYYASPETEPLILDNLESKILPASQRKDLIPVYSFNGAGLWLAKQRSKDKFLGGSMGLSKWRKLIERMKEQGRKS